MLILEKAVEKFWETECTSETLKYQENIFQNTHTVNSMGNYKVDPNCLTHRYCS